MDISKCGATVRRTPVVVSVGCAIHLNIQRSNQPYFCIKSAFVLAHFSFSWFNAQSAYNPAFKVGTHYLCSRAVLTGRKYGCRKMTPMFTAHQHGP